MPRKSILHIGEILAWADEHHERTGRWPIDISGPVIGAPGETWYAIDAALRRGLRGLREEAELSLARLLAKHRGVRNVGGLPRLTLKQILAWADAHHERTGEWPKRDSGAVIDSPGDTWRNIEATMRRGGRGLRADANLSLARLLARHRGVRNTGGLPPFTLKQILAWADAHRERTGQWPNLHAGAVCGAPGETWSRVDQALREGGRGLRCRADLSLARLLAERRGVRNTRGLPPYTLAGILAWADAHHDRTGDWPNDRSGPILEAKGETWSAVTQALIVGVRGLPGGSSLAKLLAQKRGKRNVQALPRLTYAKVLAWAKAEHRRSGLWPTARSGAVPEAPGETWNAIQTALSLGGRGFPGGETLPQLLARKGRVRRYARRKPPLTVDQILVWADAFHDRAGRWPDMKSGPIPEAPGESWAGVQRALRHGTRSLKRGTTLARLWAEHRSARYHLALPPFTLKQILAWADAHHEYTGEWPNRGSGAVFEAPEETWQNIDAVLFQGKRGLRGQSTLARLLAKTGRKPHLQDRPLTLEQILAWADDEHSRSGAWPSVSSGPVISALDENWQAIDGALRKGFRGLPGGSSLHRLLVDSGRLSS